MAQTDAQRTGEDHGHQDITVEVFVPSQVEGKTFTWPRNMRVGEAAEQAAAAFEIQGWTPSLQNEAGKVLDRDKPLVAEASGRATSSSWSTPEAASSRDGPRGDHPHSP